MDGWIAELCLAALHHTGEMIMAAFPSNRMHAQPHTHSHWGAHAAPVPAGMGAEDAQMVVESQAQTGVEPTYCMGDDIPLPVLSDKAHMLYNYFKQRFAQVGACLGRCCGVEGCRSCGTLVRATPAGVWAGGGAVVPRGPRLNAGCCGFGGGGIEDAGSIALPAQCAAPHMPHTVS